MNVMRRYEATRRILVSNHSANLARADLCIPSVRQHELKAPLICHKLLTRRRFGSRTERKMSLQIEAAKTEQIVSPHNSLTAYPQQILDKTQLGEFNCSKDAYLIACKY